MKLFLASLLFSAACALPAKRQSETPKALYFLENHPDGGSIVSLELMGDGKLGEPKKTSTGGFGLQSKIYGTGLDFPADPLLSQGAVTVRDNLLFTVNSGSNTISLFTIDPERPWDITLVGTADSLGEFPVSIDYSPKLRKACVLNGGAVGGIACYHVGESYELHQDGPFRPFPAGLRNNTTPMQGPPNSTAQISFNPNQDAVFASIKGDHTASPQLPGNMLIWPVDEMGMIRSDSDPIIGQVDGIPMDYAFTWISPSRLFLIDPSYGGSILSFGPAPDYQIREDNHLYVPAQNFSCWSAWEPSSKTLYMVDAMSPYIFTLDEETGEYKDEIYVDIPVDGQYAFGKDELGILDVDIVDGYMYGCSGTGGIPIFDLKTNQQIEYVDLTSVLDGKFMQGMTHWPKMGDDLVLRSE
ncbi:hypothetical protein CBER1_03405 [Cercospora berteroae]|uniref:SMP-30/Gluconolactonase/LRE-like region domain-containing protein n=1 Tax=Cercospora berteroae TaxID=357750 RepID=A0A2S6C8J4_9PEZI|nr:hypothetical protein CBER1_03405 [Cercospora berteroae]